LSIKTNTDIGLSSLCFTLQLKAYSMKIHTTNYQNTFIAIAPDCPAIRGEKPPLKGETKTVAGIQFDLVSKKPYTFTSDEVFFQVFAERNDLTEGELAAAKEQFFFKRATLFSGLPFNKAIWMGNSL